MRKKKSNPEKTQQYASSPLSALALKKLIATWKKAWEATDGSTPIPLSVDRALASDGYSVQTIKEMKLFLATRRPSSLTPLMKEFVGFYARTLAVQDGVLQERMAGSPTGQIFLMRAIHGYRDTVSVDLASTVSLEDALNGV